MVILFDLDGTLIDSTEAILESFHNAFRVHDTKSPNDEDIKALIGHPLDVMFGSLGVHQEHVWDYVTTYKEHYRKISTQKTLLLPKAREAVTAAKEFATLGIVTTKTGLYSRILMEHFELMHYFDVLIGREDVEYPKPHPEPVFKALQGLKCDKKDVWMIGDTSLDILAAQAAGINSIAVLSGYEDEKTLKKFTNIIYSDANEAIGYLKRRKSAHL